MTIAQYVFYQINLSIIFIIHAYVTNTKDYDVRVIITQIIGYALIVAAIKLIRL